MLLPLSHFISIHLPLYFSMIYARHSHCFSKCQLELIIENYLSLAPYYQILLQALKVNVRRFQ